MVIKFKLTHFLAQFLLSTISILAIFVISTSFVSITNAQDFSYSEQNQIPAIVEGLNPSWNQQQEEKNSNQEYQNNQYPSDNQQLNEEQKSFNSSSDSSNIFLNTSDLRVEIKKTLGVRYRLGGNNPNQGLDCSGFVRWVLRNSIQLPRTAAEMTKVGILVSKNNLQEGDLLFFNTRGRAYSHVGIYIGEGKFAHAASHSHRVEISHLNNDYWQKRYQTSRRVLNNMNG